MLLSSARYTKQLTNPWKISPLITQTPLSYFSSKNKPQSFKNKTIPVTPQSMKLVFDKDNKALIYEHLNGDVILFCYVL